jgi:hypothetical protein
MMAVPLADGGVEMVPAPIAIYGTAPPPDEQCP